MSVKIAPLESNNVVAEDLNPLAILVVNCYIRDNFNHTTMKVEFDKADIKGYVLDNKDELKSLAKELVEGNISTISLVAAVNKQWLHVGHAYRFGGWKVEYLTDDESEQMFADYYRFSKKY